MKITIGNAYFFDADENKAGIVIAKTSKNVTYLFTDLGGAINILKINKKQFKREYKAHNFKVDGWTFSLNESGQ